MLEDELDGMKTMEEWEHDITKAMNLSVDMPLNLWLVINQEERAMIHDLYPKGFVTHDGFRLPMHPSMYDWNEGRLLEWFGEREHRDSTAKRERDLSLCSESLPNSKRIE